VGGEDHRYSEDVGEDSDPMKRKDQCEYFCRI
jgi:hypothetical protein